MKTYASQMCLPEMGLQGQKKLNSSSVLVVGVGGLGCSVLPFLAASGIQRIGMIDFDKIAASNLPRQTLFGGSDIGGWKVDVASKHLLKLYPHVHFEVEKCRICSQNAEELISNYDLIVDGTDNLEARLAINDACRALQKPWVYGSIQGWLGQVSLFLAGSLCYRSLFPEGGSENPSLNCSTGGVLGPFVGLIGMIQAVAAIKWLAGIEEELSGKILLVDAKTWRFTLVGLSPEALIQDYEISHSLLKTWMRTEFIQLVDIRDPLVDINEYLERQTSAVKQKIVVYCGSGKASLGVVHRLRKEGFEAYSLKGGVSACAL